MDKNVKVSILWQIYGKLLTNKQYEIINDYFKTHQVEDGTFDNCTIVSDESLASFAKKRVHALSR